MPKRTTVKPSHATEAQVQAEQRKRNATAVNNASFMSAAVSVQYAKSIVPDLDIYDLFDEVKEHTQSVRTGDLASLETMLLGQAKALQTIFVSLARRAQNQEYLKQYTTYLNLALKAQSQSRATIQALTELKYPRQVVVAQQANINNGNQQVNNGVEQSRAAENQTEPNELMESNHEYTDKQATKPSSSNTTEHKRLDNRATGTPIASHTPLAAVAKIHRRKNPRG